jgi:hypothetical protein
MKMNTTIKSPRESNDQGADEDDGDKVESNSRLTVPHPRVGHTVQRNHHVNNILGDIKRDNN